MMVDLANWIVPAILRATAALTLAALLVALCVRFLRIRSPGAERIAWLLVLVQGVMVARLVVPLPGAWFSPPPEENAATPSVWADRQTVQAPVLEENRPPAIETAPRPTPATASPVAPSSLRAEPPAAHAGRDEFPSWTTLLLIAWAAGLIVIMSVWTARYAAFVRRLGKVIPPEPDWDAEWRDILREAAVSAPIRLVVARHLGPSLCRLPRRTMVVVPERLWHELDPSERRAVLRHELEHFRRGDLWWALTARLLAVLHWFNPCAWWAAAKFEEQSEFACDRAAAADQPARFGQLLLRLGSGNTIRSIGVQTMATSNLYQRIRRLAGSSEHSSRWRSGVPLLVVLLITGLATIRFAAMPAASMADEPPGENAEAPLPDRALLRLGMDAFAPGALVQDLAFSPDGRRMAVVLLNTPTGTLRLYDVATARSVKKLTSEVADSGWYTCLAYSPDGKRIACGAQGGRLAMWNVAERKVVFSEELHEGQINDIAFSPDGEILITAGADGGLYVRSASEPERVIQELQPGNLPPRRPGLNFGFPAPPEEGTSAEDRPRPMSLAFTPDGSKLVVGYGSSGKVTVWDPDTGKRLHSFNVFEDVNAPEVAGAPEEGRIYLSIQLLHTVAVLPDGETVMTAVYHFVPRKTTSIDYGAINIRVPEVHLWELDSGDPIADFIQPDEYGYGWADPSPNGERIAISLLDELVIRRIKDGEPLLRIPIEGFPPDQPAFSPNGKWIAVPLTTSVALFNAKTGERFRDDPATSMGTGCDADWSPSGDRLVTGSADGGVRVWNANTGELIWHRQLAPVFARTGGLPTPDFVAFSPDGTKVVAAGERDDRETYTAGIMVVYNAATGEKLREIDLAKTVVRAGAVPHEGDYVALATSKRSIGSTTVRAFDIGTGEVLYDAATQGLWSAEAMAFTPDSQSFRLVTGDGKLIQFDASTGKRLESHLLDWRSAKQQAKDEPDRPQLGSAALSADAATVVTTANNIVYRWSAETGELLGKMPQPHARIIWLGLSPDGKTVAASDLSYAGDTRRNVIRLYDAQGDQFMTLKGYDARARVIDFSPDGSKLFTGFLGKAPLVWDVTRGQ